MPGMVAFGRRWSTGSDDLVVPALFLAVMHLCWIIAFTVIIVKHNDGTKDAQDIILGYILIFLLGVILECMVAFVSVRGSILHTGPRDNVHYLLYCHIVVSLGELGWLVFGIRWLVLHFGGPFKVAFSAIMGVSVFQVCLLFVLVLMLWCTYDSAGKKWVQFTRYEASIKEKRHSQHSRKNWRHRKAMRAYEESWDRRLGTYCCCVKTNNKNRTSMSEIAHLFTEFFRDLDVVPSDVIAGLALLRRFQKQQMFLTIKQDSNPIERYMSGIQITPNTKFLQLDDPSNLHQFQQITHYMRFAMGAYGWPLYMKMNTATGLCRVFPDLRCCTCMRAEQSGEDALVQDNCCQCNVAALKHMTQLTDNDLVYVTNHVDIGETPFYVAIDQKYKNVVICVRGTLSLQDVLTDLKADAELLPLEEEHQNWAAHKGMVQAAVYIRNKVNTDGILKRAFEKAAQNTREGEEEYNLVVVGHSLGAGTAAILAILLQQEYKGLHCYSFSPPGGLLSKECMEATKSFITSIVLGKDVIPRIGLYQLELLTGDLVNVIKCSNDTKWKIIIRALCCGTKSVGKMTLEELQESIQRHAREVNTSSTSPAMFPPGRIILLVRKHHISKRGCCGKNDPSYQALLAENSDFQEVLVSPTMVTDHLPDNVLEALEKCLESVDTTQPSSAEQTKLCVETGTSSA
ncbi:diacylglycerol lipase-alpha-like [Dreissena polymorpha]|uniref:sn-1-specific diacylglycerol lipase n=1 Tax=Dreissena polymorpha TaxID=45954 RepID=A0A9D4D422_DREPO|nr:diacylglycerol lipase-alpha-like [Dreissena polymorpha]XP_052239683.1 diacylglycerol lipase-alpha-like [Dreissena polymorpha]XP_052239686.1 diacylglycerol lipase-alpha-like [Dreissena polymorpha]KAH3738736.1 hypothetical protein DPMN_045378 [Dreissena polymorpha]